MFSWPPPTLAPPQSAGRFKFDGPLGSPKVKETNHKAGIRDAGTRIVPTNAPPVAIVEQYSVQHDQPLSVSSFTGVLTNDSDPDAEPLTAVLVTAPSHGYLMLNSDGGFWYSPNMGYLGQDSFIYKASDGALDSGNITVILQVEPTSVLVLQKRDGFEGSEDGVFLLYRNDAGASAWQHQKLGWPNRSRSRTTRTLSISSKPSSASCWQRSQRHRSGQGQVTSKPCASPRR